MLHFSCGFHSYIAESCTCVIWVLRSGIIAEIQMWAMAPKKTRISWQEGRTGAEVFFQVREKLEKRSGPAFDLFVGNCLRFAD